MNIKRILKNNVSILVGQTNTGKTMLLSTLIKEFTDQYQAQVYCYGLRREITDRLNVKIFSSVREMEQIQDGIIIVDECGALFDLENRNRLRTQNI